MREIFLHLIRIWLYSVVMWWCRLLISMTSPPRTGVITYKYLSTEGESDVSKHMFT